MSKRRCQRPSVDACSGGLLATAVAGVTPRPAAARNTWSDLNTLTGNGFREEMICSIKAQAKASGRRLQVIPPTDDRPQGQIADVRNLISAGVNVIVMKPSDRSALDTVSRRLLTRAS